MQKYKFKKPPLDIVSKLRRASEITEVAFTFGLIINEDGSVFDKRTKKNFNSLVDWSKESINYETRSPIS